MFPPSQEEEFVEFWLYYRIIRKRRWLIILGVILCVGAVAVKNQRTVPVYTGRTTLMESTGMSQGGTSLFPEQTLLLDLQLRLANLATIATSQRVMNNAAETLKDLGVTTSTEEILANTTVQPVADTNILAIEVTLANPNEAKMAADVIASEFKKAYGYINNAAIIQSREFIQAQIDTTRRAMVKAQNDLRDFKKLNGIVQLDQQSVSVIQRMSQSKVDLNQTQAQYRAAQARLSRLQSELSGMKSWEVASQQTSRNPVWERLTEQLVNLETQKAAMLNGVGDQPRRGPKHPEVMNLQRQIDDTIIQKKKVTEDYIAGVNEAKNPTFMGTMDRIIQAKVDEVSSYAQSEAVKSVLSDMQREMSELPEKEAKLAELTTNVRAATDTYGLMRSKLNEAMIKEQQAKNEVSLKTIDASEVSAVNQRQRMKLILALILSPLLGIGVAFLLHYTDNTVKTAKEAEKVLGMPVLSVVPISRAHSLPRQSCPEAIDVAYQMLTSNLWIASQNLGINSIVMVSAEPNVGRSVTASNLAVALAKEGARVILVDADLRQPTQHLIFGAGNKVGLTNLLGGAATIEDVLVPTNVKGLLLVPTGPVPSNPVKLLRSSEMKEFVDQVKEAADFVIYDTPAGVAFPDPILVATQVGSAIVVHSAGRVPRGSEAELNARMDAIGVRMMGAVLNKIKREDSSSYFHYHRSYQGIGITTLPGGKKAIVSGSDRDV